MQRNFLFTSLLCLSAPFLSVFVSGCHYTGFLTILNIKIETKLFQSAKKRKCMYVRSVLPDAIKQQIFIAHRAQKLQRNNG